jgi:hypothetical protein
MEHFEEARALWQTYVPARGQADTVQGELVRAIEKLRDEAQRNGNINFRRDHELLAQYVRDTLLSSRLFRESTLSDIAADVARLLDANHPETSDAPYDRLADRVVEWSRAQTGPVPRNHNPELAI